MVHSKIDRSQSQPMPFMPRRRRGKMAYQVRDEGQAFDLYAYLATFAE